MEEISSVGKRIDEEIEGLIVPSKLGQSNRIGSLPNQHIENLNEREAFLRDEAKTYGETAKAQADRNWVFNSSWRDIERANEHRGEYNEGYEISEEDKKSIAVNYSDKEAAFLYEAESNEQLDSRIRWVQQDRDLKEKAHKDGYTAMGMSFLVDMADPALLPLLATPTKWLTKGSLLSRVGKSAAFGAGMGASVEAALMKTDTQRDWTDVARSAAAGGLMSGAFTVLGAAGKAAWVSRSAESRLQETTRRIMENSIANADDLARRMAREAAENKAVHQVREAAGDPVVHQVEAKTTLRDELIETTSSSKKKADVEVKAAAKALADLEVKINKFGAKGKAVNLNRLKANLAKAESAQRKATHEEAALKADIDRLDIGNVPAHLRERYDALAREIDGTQNTAMREKIAQHPDPEPSIPQRTDATTVIDPYNPPKTRDGQSYTGGGRDASAAAVRKPMYEMGNTGSYYKMARKFMDRAAKIPKSWQMKLYSIRPIRERLQSAHTTIDQSSNDVIRGLNSSLNNNTQGMGRGETNAAVTRERFIGSAKWAEGGRESKALLMYAKEQGFSKVETARLTMLDPAYREPFDDAVVLAMVTQQFPSPAIKLAAEARGDMLFMAASEMAASGVKGFAKIPRNKKDFRKSMKEYAKEKNYTNEETRELMQEGSVLHSEFLNAMDVARQGGADTPALKNAIKADTPYGGVDPRKDYFPFLPSLEKMQRTVSRTSRQDVVDLIALSYMQARRPSNYKVAHIIANATYERTLYRGLQSGEVKIKTIYDPDSVKALKEGLRNSGMDEVDIKDFIRHLRESDDAQGLSPRAMQSLGADMTASHNGLKMTDLVDTSQGVTTKYIADAGGSVAIAKEGFGSRQELEQFLIQVEKDGRNALAEAVRYAVGDPKKLKALEEQTVALGREVEGLKDSIRLLFGESLDTVRGGQVSGVVKASRIARKATTVVRLGQSGWASISDLSNVIGQVGFSTLLKVFPKSLNMGLKEPRVKHDLKEAYEFLTGAYGHAEGYIDRGNYVMTNMGEDAGSRVENISNGLLGKAQEHTMFLSGHRLVENTISEAHYRAILSNLHAHATGKRTVGKNDLLVLEQGGLKPAEIAQVFQHIKDNRVTAQDGTKLLGIENMDAELRHKLGNAMRHMLSHGSQRNFIGDTSIFINRELGKVTTQYRGFGLVAAEKRMVNGARNAPAVLAYTTLVGTGLALMAYKGKVHLQAAAMSEEDAEEHIRKKMSDAELLRGVISMGSQLTIANMGLDMADNLGVSLTAGMEGDDERYKGSFGADSVAIAGMADSIGDTLSGIGGALTGGEDERAQFWKDFTKSVPYLRTSLTLAGLAAYQAMTDK